MDSDLLGLQCGLVLISLSALCPFYGKEKKETKRKETGNDSCLTGQAKGLIFLLAVEAVVVCTNTAITIRIPSLMVWRGLGDAQLSSLV